MNAKLLLTQLIALAGTVLYFASFQCKSNRRLYAVQLISYVFYTAHFVLLGASTGAISYVLNLLRSLFLASKWKFAHSRGMCILLCVLQLAAGAFTWAGWISVLPVVANIASTIGGYTHNARTIRVAGICINAPLWIVYDVIVGSWAGVLDEVITILSGWISILRFGWSNLDKSNE